MKELKMKSRNIEMKTWRIMKESKYLRTAITENTLGKKRDGTPLFHLFFKKTRGEIIQSRHSVSPNKGIWKSQSAIINLARGQRLRSQWTITYSFPLNSTWPSMSPQQSKCSNWIRNALNPFMKIGVKSHYEPHMRKYHEGKARPLRGPQVFLEVTRMLE